MTDWTKVQGSQEEKPQEFDTTSSEVIVYQRRNIERITVENPDGTTTQLWEYEEREMSHEEYMIIISAIQQEQIDQIRADVDFISAMTDIDL